MKPWNHTKTCGGKLIPTICTRPFPTRHCEIQKQNQKQKSKKTKNSISTPEKVNSWARRFYEKDYKEISHTASGLWHRRLLWLLHSYNNRTEAVWGMVDWFSNSNWSKAATLCTIWECSWKSDYPFEPNNTLSSNYGS